MLTIDALQLDNLTRMKIALKKLEKEYNLPTEFQHVEGNIFGFGVKKLKLFWAGENIGGLFASILLKGTYSLQCEWVVGF